MISESRLKLNQARGVSLRPADEMDRETLFQLFIDCRPELSTAVEGWDDTQRESFFRIQFQAQQDQYQTSYPGARFDIVLVADEIIGQICVSETDKELRLVDIMLLPICRNQGIGTALLQDLLDEARHSNRALSLSVRQGNPAYELYRRLGFSKVGTQNIFDNMEWHPSRSNHQMQS